MTKADWLAFTIFISAALLLLGFMFWFSTEHPVNPEAFTYENLTHSR